MVIDDDQVDVCDGLREVHACVDSAQRGLTEDLARPHVLLEERFGRRAGCSVQEKEEEQKKKKKKRQREESICWDATQKINTHETLRGGRLEVHH